MPATILCRFLRVRRPTPYRISSPLSFSTYEYMGCNPCTAESRIPHFRAKRRAAERTHRATMATSRITMPSVSPLPVTHNTHATLRLSVLVIITGVVVLCCATCKADVFSSLLITAAVLFQFLYPFID